MIGTCKESLGLTGLNHLRARTWTRDARTNRGPKPPICRVCLHFRSRKQTILGLYSSTNIPIKRAFGSLINLSVVSRTVAEPESIFRVNSETELPNSLQFLLHPTYFAPRLLQHLRTPLADIHIQCRARNRRQRSRVS